MHAFDLHAPGYAGGWGTDPLARWMRARVLATCARFFPTDAAIVDLGCGPGLDAAVLEAMGHRVVAVDASPGMVAEARTRASDARVVDLSDLAPLRTAGPFRGALSNFGALNCLDRLDGFAAGLADILAPGAVAVLVVINRWCPAEDLALVARGRRPRRGGERVSVEGIPIPMRWLDAAAVRRALSPAFVPVYQEALGVLMAPPDLGGRPGRRARIEPYLAGWPGLRDLGDHTLVAVRRR